jgi:hypothetical protein
VLGYKRSIGSLLDLILPFTTIPTTEVGGADLVRNVDRTVPPFGSNAVGRSDLTVHPFLRARRKCAESDAASGILSQFVYVFFVVFHPICARVLHQLAEVA